MVRRGNLVVFESSNISETGYATPTKIGVHALDINPYLHEFLGRFRSIKFFDDHGLLSMVRSGNLAFFEVAISPKLGRLCPPKLVYMHLTSIPTCMNFLGRFQLIKFF